MTIMRRRDVELQMRPLVGYYTRLDQKPEKPDYDPPHTGPCPVCGEPIAEAECRTVSVMWADEPGRRIALFYRLHRDCDEALSLEEEEALSYTVLRVGDEIARKLAAH